MNTSIRRVLVLVLVLIMGLALVACGTNQASEKTVSSAGASASAGGAAEPATETAAGSEEAATVSRGILVTSNEADAMEKTTDADTLVVGASGYPVQGCNPNDSRSMQTLYQIYDQLFYYDYSSGNGELKPMLAERYEWIADGEGDGYTLHIKMREGCCYESGNEILAEDALATIQAVQASGAAKSSVDIENSYVDGKYDLYIKTFSYDPTLVSTMSTFTYSVVDKNYRDTAAEDDWWDSPDESGPFTMVENVSGSHILLQVRDSYWGWGSIQNKPSYQYLKIIIYGEASTMMVDYESGLLDACLSVDASDVKRILDDGMEHTTLHIIPTGSITCLVLPTYVDYFSDIRVREAVKYAIDVEAAADVAVGVLGTVATGYLPIGALYRTDYSASEYNLGKAAELMKEAGYADGFELNMVTTMSSADLLYAEIIQTFLAEINITVNITSYESSVAIPMFRNGETDLLINAFNGGLTHPSQVYSNMISTTTLKAVGILDGSIDELYNTAAYSIDEAAAENAIVTLQEWQHENCWQIPMSESGTTIVYRDYVKGSNVGLVGLWGITDLRFFDLAG